MLVKEKRDSNYSVTFQYDQKTDSWFAEDSNACRAIGETFLQTWSNLSKSRIANGLDTEE